MNDTDWAAIEDSESSDAYDPFKTGKPYRPTQSADDLLMGGGPPEPDDDKGPWFEAQYDGECAGCSVSFYEGDRIRADGDGGWEAEECCG